MSDASIIREELAADRIRLSRIISEAEALQERYRILTEDPENNAAGLRQLQRDINSFRTQGNEVLANIRSLTSFLNALPAGPEKTELVNENNSLVATFANWNTNTFQPFRQTVDAEVARVDQELANEAANFTQAPAPVANNVVAIEDVEGTPPNNWGIWNNDTGTWIRRGLTEQQAMLDEQELSTATDPEALQTSELEEFQFDEDGNPVTGASEEAAAQAATLEAARAQAAINERRRQANQGDWRVKLRLAPLANYLYKAANPGILEPLSVTDGVIFPYTPKIDLSYRAMYDTASLTHTNYNNYFYKSSLLDPVNLTATFTAQDTAEANYLLAVIHFFRSVTKMFYGQDAERGAPPPLVFFTGLGEYQFAEHPCLVHQFNYSLPSDVDYIRARSVMDPGSNLLNRRDRQSVATDPFSSALRRLQSLGQNVNPGAQSAPPAPPTLGQSSPTYVPTRIEISLILYPIQSRSQVSKQFSLKQYANGDLLKGGFW
jgi:hypothetical protein